MVYSNNRKLVQRSLLGVLGALGIACQPTSSSIPRPSLPFIRSTTSIESLRQAGQVERSMPLAGEVTQQLKILDGWLYQLNDGTGQVWILTQQSPPAVGQNIYVNGVLRYEAIVINGADLGDYYLEEKNHQIQEKPAPSSNNQP